VPASRDFSVLLGVTLTSAFVSGCLVSFNDYPVGDLRPAPEAGSGGATAAGGTGGGGVVGAGTGGKGGSGGTPSGGSSALGLMIDDFEDGNVTLLPADGRSGAWYMQNDGSGMQLPNQDGMLVALLEPPRESSERGLHTWGGDFFQWGALVRADFDVQLGEAEPYDISPYTGVKLWARSGDDGSYQIDVQIATVETDDDCNACDHYGSSIETTPVWQQFTLPFAAMERDDFGTSGPSEIELDQALGVVVRFPREDFDVWIDDVSFY